jgi:hypothetical protein
MITKTSGTTCAPVSLPAIDTRLSGRGLNFSETSARALKISNLQGLLSKLHPNSVLELPTDAAQWLHRRRR